MEVEALVEILCRSRQEAGSGYLYLGTSLEEDTEGLCQNDLLATSKIKDSFKLLESGKHHQVPKSSSLAALVARICSNDEREFCVASNTEATHEKIASTLFKGP